MVRCSRPARWARSMSRRRGRTLPPRTRQIQPATSPTPCKSGSRTRVRQSRLALSECVPASRVRGTPTPFGSACFRPGPTAAFRLIILFRRRSAARRRPTTLVGDGHLLFCLSPTARHRHRSAHSAAWMAGRNPWPVIGAGQPREDVRRHANGSALGGNRRRGWASADLGGGRPALVARSPSRRGRFSSSGGVGRASRQNRSAGGRIGAGIVGLDGLKPLAEHGGRPERSSGPEKSSQAEGVLGRHPINRRNDRFERVTSGAGGSVVFEVPSRWPCGLRGAGAGRAANAPRARRTAGPCGGGGSTRHDTPGSWFR